MNDVHRDIGRHDQAIETLQDDMADVKQTLARIEATLHETKGGIRMLVTVGSLGGAIGAGLAGFLAKLKGGS